MYNIISGRRFTLFPRNQINYFIMGVKAKCLSVWSFTYQETVGNCLPPLKHMHHCLSHLECKGYVFQIEKGEESGRLHYQGNIRLKEPMEQNNLRIAIKSILRKYYAKGCLSLRQTHNLDKSNFYCAKQETRLKGPWIYPYWTYLGQDIMEYIKMFPWQKDIYDLVINEPPHDRHVHLIVDNKGKTGKSTLAKTLGFKHGAVVIPLGLTSAQMKAAVVGAGAAQLYILDLPRNNSSYTMIFDLIEEIKRGMVISSFQGKLKTLYMSRPHIVCFSNAMPSLDYLSRDMWKIYHITRPAMELVEQKKFVSDVTRNIYKREDVSKGTSDRPIDVEAESEDYNLSGEFDFNGSSF